MNGPRFRTEQAEALLETPYLNFYDLHPAPGRHYFEASRRKREDLIALKSEEELRRTLPDAVSCFIVVRTPGEEPRLLLQYEYRYPAGRPLLGITAGLIDPDDRQTDEPLFSCARREIFEETGLTVGPDDRLSVISPFVYSSPGLSDESNALVGAVLSLPDLSSLSSDGEEASEQIEGYRLLTRQEASEILAAGTAPDGSFLPLHCWCALSWFVSGSWED